MYRSGINDSRNRNKRVTVTTIIGEVNESRINDSDLRRVAFILPGLSFLIYSASASRGGRYLKLKDERSPSAERLYFNRYLEILIFVQLLSIDYAAYFQIVLGSFASWLVRNLFGAFQDRCRLLNALISPILIISGVEEYPGNKFGNLKSILH